MRRTPALATALLAVSLATTACGSTVQIRSTGVPSNQDGLGTGGSTGTLDTTGRSTTSGTTGTTGSVTGLGTGSSTGSTSTSGGTGSSGTGSGTTTGAAGSGSNGTSGTSGGEIPVTGHGYDAKTIYIGVPTQNDAATATRSLGLSGLDYGNANSQVNAVLNDINQRGGILGRKLVAVFHDVSSADAASNPEGAASATCTALTEDKQVVAVINEVAIVDTPNFQSCLAQHKTPEITGNFVPDDTTHQRQSAPFLYELVAAAFDDVDPTWITRLKAQGYFNGWNTSTGTPGTGEAKIGLIYADNSTSTRIGQHLKAVLTAQGFDVAATYAYDASNASAAVSSLSSAVLPFRSAGVTHVMPIDTSIQFFMSAAEQQKYRPRYGLTSYSSPGTLLQANAPAAQLASALGIGWLPVSDVDAAHDPGGTTGAANCKAVMRAGRADLPSRAAYLTGYSFCDAIYLLAATIRVAGNLTPAAIRAAIPTAASSVRSALLFRASMAGGRTYVPGGVRDLGFDSGCSCFTFRGTRTTAF